MSDGARCHYCRRVPCECPEPTTDRRTEVDAALERIEACLEVTQAALLQAQDDINEKDAEIAHLRAERDAAVQRAERLEAVCRDLVMWADATTECIEWRGRLRGSESVLDDIADDARAALEAPHA